MDTKLFFFVKQNLTSWHWSALFLPSWKMNKIDYISVEPRLEANMFFFGKKKPTQPQEGKKQAGETPRFVARLKHDIGDEVWAVSQDGHFIRVYGEKGEDRILYRFSDAVHDLRGVEGTCVHLEHWVRKDAIDRVEPIDGSFEIVLKNQQRFPVCESYRRVLQENIWD